MSKEQLIGKLQKRLIAYHIIISAIFHTSFVFLLWLLPRSGPSSITTSMGIKRRLASGLKIVPSHSKENTPLSTPRTPSPPYRRLKSKGVKAWTKELTTSSKNSFFGSDSSRGAAKSSLSTIFDKYRGKSFHILHRISILILHR